MHAQPLNTQMHREAQDIFRPWGTHALHTCLQPVLLVRATSSPTGKGIGTHPGIFFGSCACGLSVQGEHTSPGIA